ncbi:Na+/melibiose symporter [Clostridium sp. USBA 49]|uniref:MFS transporter n=1 Tax=Clostridium sp. USBA 49 TaxID=1881060 RepID=UPI00099A9E02|nr:MFS transporter [Clostridium sp. USBA 49]SKA82535.1 Na+/melibiose symporter [Clostridium sp. USBA 49]
MKTEIVDVKVSQKSEYNTAKTWQIGFFALNNTATNIAMFIMGFYAFFTQNILGLAAVVVGSIAMSMRIWDAVTDPIVGYLMDKTDGKFGKFRPFMIVGNIILFISVNMIFRTPANWSINQKYWYTTIIYVIYIIGYTLQCTVTKGAQAVLTNDPKQRPVFTMFDAVYNTILFSGGTFLLTAFMAPKYPKNMIDPNLWKDASLIFMTISFIFTILAIIGIWQKDRTEFFGLGGNNVQVKFKDYLDILKHNRPIQMLVIAASTDKLASTALRGAQVYFFSNILLNSSLQGKFSLANAIPVMIITTLGVNWSRKAGIKKAFVSSSWASMLMLFLNLALTPILTKSYTGIIILLVLMTIQTGVMGISGNIVIPMIADCSDYETYRSGRFVPGMMGTLFSFVDKIISSLSSFIIGIVLAWAGYGNVVIQPNTALNTKFYIGILFCVYGLPILGHIASILAMKWYHLDNATMDKIKKEIALKKAAIDKV